MADNIKLLIRHKAKLDIKDAHNWYESQREGLGDIFLKDFASCINFICENPKSYPVILTEIRRALLKKFPYNVFYLFSKNKVVILACFHSKRNPNTWRARI